MNPWPIDAPPEVVPMDDLLTASPGWRRPAGYVIATAGVALLVAALLPFRDDVDVLSMGWAFLGLVVVAAAVGGLGPGILASFLAFGAYNYFFFPPYHTFRVAEPEHVVVLVVFLALSVLIAVLLARARSRAEIAEARERELRLQQDLATALVDPSPDNERYALVLGLMVSQLGLGGVSLYVTPATGGGLDPLTSVGEPGSAPELERLPLVVGRRSLGLLVATGSRPALSDAERRTLAAFGNQLALVLERDRMLRASVETQRSPSSR
jgi:two-component system sensor histidine kinase KdpD